MDFILIGILIFGFVGIFIFLNQELSDKKESSGSEKLFLEMIGNLRKEVRESSENSQKEIRNLSESSRKEIQEISERSRKEMQERLDKIDMSLQKNVSESSRTIQAQFKQSSEIIKSVTEKLAKLDETNKQVLNFSEKMQSLENILKNPKQRGVLGEYFLETLLSNFFAPGQFRMQYKFRNGETVDAVIFFKKQIIPIDSKFSLEKYNLIQKEGNPEVRVRLKKEFMGDIKKRIAETSKYIRPNESTTDFAFMFIPAEGVFYTLLNYKVGGEEKSLIEYAFDKRVIITSPSSFFAYMQTVIQGLKALQIEDQAKEIQKQVGNLGRHLRSFETFLRKMGGHLSTTVNMYNNAYKEFGKINKDVMKITEGESGRKIEVEKIEKPSVE